MRLRALLFELLPFENSTRPCEGLLPPSGVLRSCNCHKGGCKKLPSGFFSAMGVPPLPHTLLAEFFFAEKTLAEMEGTPCLNGKSAKLFWKKIPSRTKNDVFVLDKVKDGPKIPYNRP